MLRVHARTSSPNPARRSSSSSMIRTVSAHSRFQSPPAASTMSRSGRSAFNTSNSSWIFVLGGPARRSDIGKGNSEPEHAFAKDADRRRSRDLQGQGQVSAHTAVRGIQGFELYSG